MTSNNVLCSALNIKNAMTYYIKTCLKLKLQHKYETLKHFHRTLQTSFNRYTFQRATYSYYLAGDGQCAVTILIIHRP